jgi:plasmid stability protein
MPAIHVRDVPAEILASLRRRAASHGRSLQRELLEILGSAAKAAPSAALRPPIRLKMADSEGEGETLWRREDIYGDDGR